MRHLVAVIALAVVGAGCLSGVTGDQPAPSSAQANATAQDEGQASDQQAPAEDTTAPEDVASNATSGQAATMPGPTLVQAGCTTVFTGFYVQAEQADPYRPEGFSFTDRPAEGVVGAALKAWTCTDSNLDGAAIGPVSTAILYFPVEPPGAYQRSDVTCDYVLSHTVTDDPAMAALFDAWNMGSVAEGTVAVPDEGDAPKQTEVEGGGVALALRGDVPRALDNRAYQCRYFGVSEGQATNAVLIPVAPSTYRVGPGVLTFEGSEPFGTLVGIDHPNSYPMAQQVWPADVVAYTWTNEVLG